MRSGLYLHKLKNDEGVSLVELIVVISIMVIVTGVVSISISLMFSRDAESVTKAINDGMTEARMVSMSKPGNYEMVIDIANNSVVINKVIGPGTYEEYKKIKYKKNVSIAVRKPSDAPGGLPTELTSEYKIEFDKSNGSISKIGGVTINPVTSPTNSGVYSFIATSGRLATKTSTVNVVTTTGRHYVAK